LLRRNNSISDGVSIRGAGEVPSFRLSKVVEAVTKAGFPSVFEGYPIFVIETPFRNTKHATL
jgi:hypothetical protein